MYSLNIHFLILLFKILKSIRTHAFLKCSLLDLENTRSLVVSKVKSSSKSNITSIHIRFVPCQLDNRSRNTANSKLHLESLRLWMGQKLRPYNRSKIVSIRIRFVPCQWDHTFQDAANSKFNQKSKVKVMRGNKGQGILWIQHHINSYPFHSVSIRPAIPEIWLCCKLALKVQGKSHVGWRSKVKV